MNSSVAVWLLLAGLSGCASAISVNSDYDHGTDFRSVRTFAFTQNTDPFDPLFPMYDNELNRKRIQDAIIQEMQRLGLTYKKEGADVTVDYHIVIKDKSTIETYHPEGGRFWDNYEVEVYDFTEGTLVVHLVDNRHGGLIWQGSAVSVLNAHARHPEKKIRQAVARIFELYPTAM